MGLRPTNSDENPRKSFGRRALACALKGDYHWGKDPLEYARNHSRARVELYQ